MKRRMSRGGQRGRRTGTQRVSRSDSSGRDEGSFGRQELGQARRMCGLRVLVHRLKRVRHWLAAGHLIIAQSHRPSNSSCCFRERKKRDLQGDPVKRGSVGIWTKKGVEAFFSLGMGLGSQSRAVCGAGLQRNSLYGLHAAGRRLP